MASCLRYIDSQTFLSNLFQPIIWNHSLPETISKLGDPSYRSPVVIFSRHYVNSRVLFRTDIFVRRKGLNLLVDFFALNWIAKLVVVRVGERLSGVKKI